MLEIWIREVVAMVELFPSEIQSNLLDLMKIPSKIATNLRLNKSGNLSRPGSRARIEQEQDSDDSTSSANAHDRPTRKSMISVVHARNLLRSSSILLPTKSSVVAPRKKGMLERMLRTGRKKLRQMCAVLPNTLYSLVVSPTDECTSTVCLGRNERLINKAGLGLGPGFGDSSTLQERFFLQMMHYVEMYVYIVVCVMMVDYTVGPWARVRYGLCLSTTAKVLIASCYMMAYLLCLDYDRLDGEEGGLPYLRIQQLLRVFLDSPTFEYTEEAMSFPCIDDMGSDAGTDDDIVRDYSSSDDNVQKVDRDHSVALTALIAQRTEKVDSSRTNGTSSTRSSTPAAVASKRTTVFGANDAEKVPQKLHETLVPGSTYDNCEFSDVSAEARAMYTCRAATHPLKVRGETYLEDQKKIAPGPAMSKLMLLELYEVEGKDGDRHDHIASRGKAKQRLEALRTLPEKLFFIVLNFQVPGDPPVSIVSYFALPLDLMERYPSRATAKFIEMFERFADAPRTERERLAAWGVTVPDSDETAPTEGDEEGALHRSSEVVRNDITKANTHVNSSSARSLSAATGGDNSVRTKIDSLSPLLIDEPPLPLPKPSSDQKAGTPTGRAAFLSSFTTSPSPSPGAGDAPAPESKSTLIKIGHKGTNIVRKAAAIGGGSLRRVSNYFSGQERPEKASPTSRGGREGQGPPVVSPGQSPESTSTSAAGASRQRSNSEHNWDVSNRRNRLRDAESPSADDSVTTAKRKPKSFLVSSSQAGGLSASLAADVGSAQHEAPSSSAAPSGGAIEQARVAAAKVVSAAPASPPAPTTGGWKMPVDITWPTAADAGTLPQSDYRNERFKLIPSITVGPWVVRAAVRATPALLGKKVVQRYFRGEDYLEIDVHIGSSVIASNIVGVCRGYARHVINDCGVVIQGESAAELPETVLGCAALNHIDVNIRKKLD